MVLQKVVLEREEAFFVQNGPFGGSKSFIGWMPLTLNPHRSMLHLVPLLVQSGVVITY